VYAVISDRTRQATVRVGDVVDLDLDRDLSPGDPVTLDRVLLVGDEGDTRLGTPTLAGVVVRGEVLAHVKGPKEVAFRFKRRKNVRVKRGHRQGYTRVRITGIEG